MQANHLLYQEPLFYGGKTPQNGLSAEDFIARVDNLQRSHTWNDAVAAANAITYLRGDAADYFTTGLRSRNRATWEAARGGYIAFRRHFVHMYFKISSTGDLSIDHANLRQTDKEDALTFAGRVSSALGKMEELVHTDAPPHDSVAALAAILDVVINRLPQNVAATNQERAAIAAGIQTLHRDGQIYGHRKMIDLSILRTMADGIRNPKLKEVVRAAERSRKSVDDTFDIIQEAERTMSKRDLAVPAQPSRGSGYNGNRARVAAVSVSEDEDDSADADVAPIHAKKQKSKKKASAASQSSGSGAAKKREDRPKTWRDATRNTPPPASPCFRCKQTGHWAKFCEAPHPVDDVDDGSSGSHGNQGKANARG